MMAEHTQKNTRCCRQSYHHQRLRRSNHNNNAAVSTGWFILVVVNVVGLLSIASHIKIKPSTAFSVLPPSHTVTTTALSPQSTSSSTTHRPIRILSSSSSTSTSTSLCLTPIPKSVKRNDNCINNLLPLPLLSSSSLSFLHDRPSTRLFSAGDDDDDDEEEDYDDDDEDNDDDWEATDDDLLNELEGLADLDEEEEVEDVNDADDDDVDIDYDDENDEDGTKKIMATDDEYDEDEDELDGLNIWEEEDDEDEDYEAEEVNDEDISAEFDDDDVDGDNSKDTTDLSHMIDEDDDDPNLVNIVPLEDDPDDPLYNARKVEVEETVARREAESLAAQAAARAMEEETEPREILSPVDAETLEQLMKEMKLDGRNELDDIVDEVDSGIDDDTNLDLLAKIKEAESLTADEVASLIDWNKVETLARDFDWNIPEEVEDEMWEVLLDFGESAYNVSKWLIYELDFNVTNLILASIKHNPDAPIIFAHWYPQLAIYRRYQDARDRDFDYTWDDVRNADITELERYYAGFGYYEIPDMTTEETGAILLTDIDEEEIKMAAFDQWFKSVYNENWDKKEFVDDEIDDDDNVYSDFFEVPLPPDTPKWEDTQEDLEDWHDSFEEEEEEGDKEALEYRDYMGTNIEYSPDPENDIFEKEFRGHLIIACGEFDDDLDVAEKITTRFQKEFGRHAVYVETRIISHARKDDNVFEVWLEGFDIDLLHSRRRTSMNARGWDGPADVDDDQLEYLVDRVRYLISDDALKSERVVEAEYEL
jgi:hypothetical protein